MVSAFLRRARSPNHCSEHLKTIEFNLRHIYEMLGVTSRDKLTAALATRI